MNDDKLFTAYVMMVLVGVGIVGTIVRLVVQ